MEPQTSSRLITATRRLGNFTSAQVGKIEPALTVVAAVEYRFGQVNRSPVTIEWLSDNGSCYVAGDTRSFARDIGLEPRTTPLESPQSNGMAEAFVRTIKCDYVHVSPRPNAGTVMRQLPAWIAHYNEVHPHKALGYRFTP
jgi:putative transposase